MPLSRLEVPANTIMIAEAPSAWNALGNINEENVVTPIEEPGQGWLPGQDTFSNNTSSSSISRRLPPVHLGGWNYAYADGHVKWQRPESTIGVGSGGTFYFPRGQWTIHANDDR
jgi:prepilin-type processing-associated H-X9-DG protein